MQPPFLRSLLALLAAGALVFSPVSERVSEKSWERAADVSALVLMPTVESAVGAVHGGLTPTTAPTSMILQDDIVGLAQALLVFFVLLMAPAGRIARCAGDPLGQRAPPSPA